MSLSQKFFKTWNVNMAYDFPMRHLPGKDTYVDTDFQNEDLESVIEQLLYDQDLEYKIVSNNILLRKSSNFKAEENDAYTTSLHIRGKVINNITTEALEYATIAVENSSIGTYSDPDGSFDLEIPAKYSDRPILVTYVGYQSVAYQISELKDHYILASMETTGIEFEEVEIVNRKKPIKIGGLDNSISLSKTQIRNSTSGVMGGDIQRTIQLLPGITAHDDDSADIKIRGSNSDETLMILDGMPIYNSSHYYGIFSSVNTAYIDSVNIFKNSYPIEYGGKTAGLVELFSNSKQPEKI